MHTNIYIFARRLTHTYADTNTHTHAHTFACTHTSTRVTLLHSCTGCIVSILSIALLFLNGKVPILNVLCFLAESKSTRRECRNFEKPWQVHPKKPKKSKSDLAMSSISPPSPESKSREYLNHGVTLLYCFNFSLGLFSFLDSTLRTPPPQTFSGTFSIVYHLQISLTVTLSCHRNR